MHEIKPYLSPGYLLDKYRIDKLLGAGGFSLVYLAYHIPTKARVVIKEYYPDGWAVRMPGGRVNAVSDDLQTKYNLGIKRFFAEVSAVSKVNHPNIVRVSNVFRANNTLYMVMNYDEGQDLRFYVKKHRSKLTQKFLASVFPPLLRGLQAFHDQGLLHLDIKPANILLLKKGAPLLLDFGAVQHFNIEGTTVQQQTLTLGYAPIEQHRHSNLGPWTDVYSTAATLYSCVTGKAPPPAPDRLERDKMSSPNRLFSRYSKKLLAGIEWALHMDYHKRPQSPLELLDACFDETDCIEKGYSAPVVMP